MKHQTIEHTSGAEGVTSDRPRRLSTVLSELAAVAVAPVTIAEMREALGDRSLAALLAFFAAINLIPLPPGATLLLGPPLIIIAAQMIFGRGTVWLPRRILARSIAAERLRRMNLRFIPRLLWLENLIRPRLWPFPSQKTADRVIGVLALILALAVTVPIPLGNWTPALALFLIALAISERDGALLLAGIVVGILSFAIIALILGSADELYGFLIG